MGAEPVTADVSEAVFDDRAVLAAVGDAADTSPRFVVRRRGERAETLSGDHPTSSPAAFCARLHAYFRFLDTALGQPIHDVDRTSAEVRYTTTWVESAEVVCACTHDVGVFVGIAPDQPVVPVVEALRRLFAGEVDSV
ncbi:MAG: hypothetical protein ABEJ22_09180 [Haloferacaceae archaeon]